MISYRVVDIFCFLILTYRLNCFDNFRVRSTRKAHVAFSGYLLLPDSRLKIDSYSTVGMSRRSLKVFFFFSQRNVCRQCVVCWLCASVCEPYLFATMGFSNLHVTNKKLLWRPSLPPNPHLLHDGHIYGSATSFFLWYVCFEVMTTVFEIMTTTVFLRKTLISTKFLSWWVIKKKSKLVGFKKGMVGAT